MPDALLTAEEVAALLGTTDRTVRRWRKSGRLRAAKRVGGAYLFAAAEVARVMQTPRPKVGRPAVVATQPDELPLGQAS
jgi:excisionase family DNA binding protein